MTVPVSVKGVVIDRGKVLLLRNERDEWELPGGKLEPDEEPEDCCRREILEETGLTVRVQALIDAWLYRAAPEGNVLILTYGCELFGTSGFAISDEHRDGKFFADSDFPRAHTPAGYLRSIDRWRLRLGQNAAEFRAG